MTLQEMRERKRELGYSNKYLAQKSGIPLSTIQKVLSGRTTSPRRDTILALETTLSEKETGETRKDALSTQTSSNASRTVPYSKVTAGSRPSLLKETSSAYDISFSPYTPKDIEALPDDVRAELIDGQIYSMGAPSRIHQHILVEVLFAVKNYIRSHHGSCQIYPSPFAVYLNGEEGQDLLEPDLSVICNPDRLHEKGCMGAPDWIMEIVSSSTESRDYGVKLFKYRAAGVKEYWIVHPDKRIVTVYHFDKTPEQAEIYTFEEEIPFSLFPGLSIRLADDLP
ncbi:MAG: Uma2 family endonuclease [Lachnospiraceae bacterium]|nr:Uma2 family endonuclease [Lachnospiraceae bacterium]